MPGATQPFTRSCDTMPQRPIKKILVLIFCLGWIGVTPAWTQKVDSLEALLPASTGVARLNLCLQLADAYGNKDWEKSVGYADEALALAAEAGSDSLLFESNFTLSKSYLGLADYSKALVHIERARELSFDERSRAAALHHLGRVREARSEYQDAMKHYLEAIEIYKGIGDKARMANTLNSLSFVYKEMEQYEKAIELLEEAGTLYIEAGNKGRLASVTFNIGLMTMEMDRYEEAIPYFRKAVSGLKESEEPSKFSSFYNNLANCYQKLLDKNPSYYDSALMYGKMNLVLKERLKDNRGIANAHNNLAAIYERGSDYTHSFEHATLALRISDSLHLKPIKKNALSYLITAEIALKRTEKLNSHFEDYIDVVEELNSETSSRTMSEMATVYETEKKDAENMMLLETNIRQGRLNWILGGGGVLLLLLLGLAMWLYGGKQKANQTLETQKQQIETSLREKEALLREIHHRVKNNLQVISSLLNMQTYYVNDLRMVDVLTEGQNRVKAMGLIHQKLYQTEHLSEIDFQEYTEQLISYLSTAFGGDRKIRSVVNGSSIKLDIDTAIPLGLILNELITNSYKYAFDGVDEGKLEVDLTIEEQYYHMRVSDSGQGLPPDFSEEKLTSLGLNLVRMLIEQLDGSLTISNEPGASFRIRFKQSRLTG